MAIELAAARARLLPPDALLERLDRRLDFLVGGPRDLPERQQALRRTIQWSYDLLDVNEQRVFGELGIFVGSFSLDAAQAVCTIASEQELLDLLASLVDKSLLQAQPTAAEPHFRMLEMIAEFARELLAATPDRDAVGPAPRRVLPRSERRTRRGDTGTGPTPVARAPGSRTVRPATSARRWLGIFKKASSTISPRCVVVVDSCMDQRSARRRRRLGARRAGFRCHHVGAVAGPLARSSPGSSTCGAARTAMPSRNLMDAESTGRRLGDDQSSRTRHSAGACWPARSMAKNDPKSWPNSASPCLADWPTTWAEAGALNVLGWLYVSQERFEGNGPLFFETLAKAKAAGDGNFISLAEVNLAEYFLDRGDAEQAAELLVSCASRHRSVRLRYSVAYLLDTAARLIASRGDATDAARLLGAASHLRGRGRGVGLGQSTRTA